ncbi:hypothetical protein [Paenibacillus sp. MMS18-CY102]|uniref:hypothetical protein n=1 Tax=Paenibacillus sp. MMS18-CY102 TaxID=2682849 RepID=UPI0013667D79|nr:hypothetical protein [Paenibacillus sp. MMS18-CY102]MWC27854.1 hypothetical protein [Paenibacillus sp. MMS18-CY102]
MCQFANYASYCGATFPPPARLYRQMRWEWGVRNKDEESRGYGGCAGDCNHSGGVVRGRGYTFIIFSQPKAADPEERWIGLERDGAVYRIGTIGGEAYESQVEASSVALFGQPYICLAGYCGANCAVEHYIEVKDGMPVPLLFLNAPARVADWNGDGMNELLYQEGMPLDVVLIQRWGGKLISASVGEALHAAKGVSYDDAARRFILYNEQGEQHYRVAADGNFLELVSR